MPSSAPGAAFSVFFEATGWPGLVRATALGCSSLGGPCAAGSTTPTDASARIQVLLGLLPALRTAPAAPLTVHGAVDDQRTTDARVRADAAPGHADAVEQAVDGDVTVETDRPVDDDRDGTRR